MFEKRSGSQLLHAGKPTGLSGVLLRPNLLLKNYFREQASIERYVMQKVSLYLVHVFDVDYGPVNNHRK